jgi:hypothetical protein
VKYAKKIDDFHAFDIIRHLSALPAMPALSEVERSEVEWSEVEWSESKESDIYEFILFWCIFRV